MPLPTVNFLRFIFSEILHAQNFKGQGYYVSKVTKYQLTTPYSFPKTKSGQDFETQGHYGKVKGQIKVTPYRCTPTTPYQCP